MKARELSESSGCNPQALQRSRMYPLAASGTHDGMPATVTAAASRPSSAVRPFASSLPASAPRAAGAVVPAPDASFPQEEECAGAANARSAEEFATAEQARAGWFPAQWAAAQACRGEQRCSLDARPAYWPLAELRHDWLEGYRAPLPLWPVRRRGR